MIIFLYGGDTFRSRKKLKSIKEKFIKEIDKSSLNVEVLNGEKIDIPKFEEAVSTRPFLAKKRLVIVEDLISKSKGQKLQNEVLEILDKKNLEEIILVFWEGDLGEAKGKKTESLKTKNLLNRLKKEKFAQEFKLLSDHRLKEFIQEEVKSKNGQIDSSATDLLIILAENDTWRINSEIDKLLAFSKDQKITRENVKALVQNKIDDDIFKLTDALGQKNKGLALKLISDQLKKGTSAVELLSKVTWQFKNLLLLKSFVEENGPGYPDTRAGYQLGLHPFVIKKTMAQLPKHDLAILKNQYASLLEIDRKLKTSQLNPEVLFDLFVVRS